jgi:hypothetical protein
MDRQGDVEEALRDLGCYNRETRGSGTATVAAALALFVRYGGNYKHAVVHAANSVGTDADTIGAMAGSLTGAFVGYTEIPEAWASQLQDFGYMLKLAAYLTDVAIRRPPTVTIATQGEPSIAPSITAVLKTGQLRRGLRVSHALFGDGWIRDVSVQPVRRRGAGQMRFADVVFDIGQSCKFKAYIPRGA